MCSSVVNSKKSQFLIGKVERKNLVHDNDSSVSRTTSQFLIGKVELYIFMDCKFDDPIVMSQFLIGKVLQKEG